MNLFNQLTKKITILALGIFFLNAAKAQHKITVDATAKGENFEHFWSKCVGAGRANEGLRASWLEHMQLVKDNCGFEYCRFHGLFHDDMFVYKEVNGKAVYNWQYIDDLFDRMLTIGVRPFVELSFFPKELAAKESRTQFWWKGYVTPNPEKFDKWADLVSAFTKHCIQRYGLEEVKSWYFEVWNEPDLRGFWDGTKSQYFELYRVSVNAIKAIDPALRVGGPATSNFVPDERFDGETEDKTKHKTLTVSDINTLEWRGVWIKDFLNFCAKEKLPVDFVSTHPYPTDWAIDPESGKGGGRTRKVDATLEDLKWLKETIAKSVYPKAEIHLTEWSSSPSPRDNAHDFLPAAAYVVKINTDCIGLTNSLSYWTFTDVFEEGGAGNTIFHGGFGMINYQGIVKPTYHAYRMLNELGDELLYRKDGVVVTRNSKTGKLVAILYNYPSEVQTAPESGSRGLAQSTQDKGTAQLFYLKLTGLKANSAISIETLDKQHGNAIGAWQQMGSPEPPNRKQVSILKQKAQELKKDVSTASDKGELNYSQSLESWSVVLIKEL